MADMGLPVPVSNPPSRNAIAGIPEDRRAAMAVRKNLDDDDARKLQSKLMGSYVREIELHSENREQMAIDHDFYDGKQFTDDEEAELEDRGQTPIIYNVTATTIDWITGSEKRMRTDFKILPRRKDGGKAATRKTQLMKYHSDVNDLGFHQSRAFEDAVKGGVGWTEDQLQDDGGEDPIYSRYETWRAMLWDSAATEMDLSDARYEFRSKWVDTDIAKGWFPERAAQIDQAATTNLFMLGRGDEDGYGDVAMDSQEMDNGAGMIAARTENLDTERERVRLIECWYRVPAQMQVLRGGQFAGERFDPMSRGHYNELSTGDVVVVEKADMEMRVCIMTTHDLLFDARTPYRHNQFPFTPIWCYRRNKDNMPYGVVRRIRSIARDVNFRASKALHILNANKALIEEGAVDDLDAFEKEKNRADGTIVYKKGHKVELGVDRELAPAHMEIMSRSIQLIQSASGVTDENLGRRTNATSGIAIERRQDQGALATAGIFDNHLYSKKKQGAKVLSLIEQFFTEQKQFRITNTRGTPVYVTVNDGLPEHDITATKADYIISDDEWRASVRQAEMEQLVGMLKELAPAAPQIVLTVLDLIVEGMDIAARDEIVARIRQMTGQRDPDAEEITPEEQARMDDEKAAKDRAIRMEEATIAEKEASAGQKAAAAGQAEASAENQRATMAGANVETLRKALETALAMLQVPAAVPMADTVAREAGFVGKTDQDVLMADAAATAALEDMEMAAAEEEAMAAQEQAMAEQQDGDVAGQPPQDQLPMSEPPAGQTNQLPPPV